MKKSIKGDYSMYLGMVRDFGYSPDFIFKLYIKGQSFKTMNPTKMLGIIDRLFVFFATKEGAEQCLMDLQKARKEYEGRIRETEKQGHEN